ncbi:MAG: extracellular solute-binding protein [Pseudomonadota bacterium]
MQKMIYAAALMAALPASAEVTISHGYSIFGDLKYGPDFTHFDYANPDAPKGGTMSQRQLFGNATFNSLNYWIIKGDNAPEVFVHMYDPLMVESHDEPDAVYGLVAETIEYPEDLSYIIFNLRPEARFHDGEPLTASDVVFTVEMLQTEGHPFYRSLLEGVEKVTAENDHRVRFDLAEGVGASYPADIATTLILPEHFYDEETPFDETWMTAPVGSGPYLLETADPGRTIRFCRDPDYWAADLPVNVGKNNFECFAYEYFADDLVGLEAFKAGEYLMRVEYRSASWAEGYDFPAADEGWVKQMLLPDGRPSTAQGMWFNLRREKFKDIRVRQAVDLAFNFDWTNESIFYNAYARTESFFENTAMEASGVPEGAELALLEEFRDQLPETVFSQSAFTPYNGGPRLRDRRALREATALLDAAGWPVGDDGLRRNASGEVLRVEIVDDSRSLERVIGPFVENMQALGIDAEFIIVPDPAQWTERRQNFDFDMSFTAWSVSSTPGANLRAFYGSVAAESTGSNNLSGIADPVVDALIERAVAAGSREELNTVVAALDRVLRDRHIWVGAWHIGSHRVAVWDVFGMPEETALYDFNRGVEFWWLEQEKLGAIQAEGGL